MKITCNRKEDILRRKAEYEDAYNKQKEAHDAEFRNFRNAQFSAVEPTKKYLEDLFAKYPTLHAKVVVDPWGRYDSDGISVRIDVNDSEKFNDDTALSWDYSAYLTSDGEVKRESSSWSGMKAVTRDQLKNLEETVAVLKELADLDWENLLKKEMPKYEDYVTTREPDRRNKPDFDRELIEAEIEDIIGQRKMIEVKPFSSSWYNGNVFVAIVKDSGSQYTIVECPSYAQKQGEASKYFDHADSHRVRKNQIVPVVPTNVIEV